jgi:hypothetical protein
MACAWAPVGQRLHFLANTALARALGCMEGLSIPVSRGLELTRTRFIIGAAAPSLATVAVILEYWGAIRAQEAPHAGTHLRHGFFPFFLREDEFFLHVPYRALSSRGIARRRAPAIPTAALSLALLRDDVTVGFARTGADVVPEICAGLYGSSPLACSSSQQICPRNPTFDGHACVQRPGGSMTAQPPDQTGLQFHRLCARSQTHGGLSERGRSPQ